VLRLARESHQKGAVVNAGDAQPLRVAGPAQAAPGELPKQVSIKTRTRTFNRNFYFALSHGRVWFRANEEATAVREPWRLLELDGRPSGSTGSSIEMPVRIEQITSDADELIALSDTGHFYFLRLKDADDIWRGSTGVPAGIVLLDARHRGNRGFALGRRNEDVLYWVDPVGNPHHWGRDGISTVYFLSEDGREITIFDTGLPADISRHIGGPERGRFIAENIAASASTIFVIDAYGRMYTRLADFDTLGCNPMFFNYSYTATRRPHDRGEDPRTLYSVCRLPAEDWQQHPEIPLQDNARISREITILQNGHGNAREMRVAGTDSAGRMGYYWKPLAGSSWNFRRTEEEIKRSRFLERGHAGRGPGRHPAHGSDLRYRGELRVKGDRVLAELPDFNLHCSPATLRLNAGDEHVDLKLFTLDAWTYAVRDDPGRDGTPRVFLATIQLPGAAVTTGLAPPTARVVESLRRWHNKPNAFLVRASTTYVQLRSNAPLGLVAGGFTRAACSFQSVRDARVHDVERRNGYLRLATAEYLTLEGAGPPTSKAAADAHRWQKLALNRHTLAQITAHRRTERKNAIFETLVAWAFSLVNLIARLTLIAFLPRVRNISQIGGVLLHGQARTSRDLVRDAGRDFDAAQALLRQRIAALKPLLGVASRRSNRAPLWRPRPRRQSR
jgi:hypothetical protein